MSILAPVHKLCRVNPSPPGGRCPVIARLNYLDERGFLGPLRAGSLQGGGVGRAVDLGQHGALQRLQVGAALWGRVAQRQRSEVALRTCVGGHAVGPAAQAGGLGRGGATGAVLQGQQT